jgi:hypothetical protein
MSVRSKVEDELHKAKEKTKETAEKAHQLIKNLSEKQNNPVVGPSC